MRLPLSCSIENYNMCLLYYSKLNLIYQHSCVSFFFSNQKHSFYLGHHKCRENWPENSQKYERAFNLFLDVILLVLPLLMLAATYSLITKTLWQDMKTNSNGFNGNSTVVNGTDSQHPNNSLANVSGTTSTVNNDSGK